MITHAIEKYKPVFQSRVMNWKQAHSKPRYVVGSEEHKRSIYARLIEEMANTNHFDENNCYSVKGRNCIVLSWADFENVEWDGLKCCLIEVIYDKDGDFDLVHPSDLKKPRS